MHHISQWLKVQFYVNMSFLLGSDYLNNRTQRSSNPMRNRNRISNIIIRHDDKSNKRFTSRAFCFNPSTACREPERVAIVW